jgi:DNA-binding NarL/FixJ family response regulator
MPPSIRYATTSDAVRIAYATMGEGLPLLCLPPFPFSHLEAGWGLDGQRQWYERLARGAQVALYDARGTGLSDRDRAEFTLDAMTRDLEAVVNRLGWERFALCGFFNAVPVAIDYTARHPEVVTDLVIWGGFARGSDIYPVPLPPEAPDLVGIYWNVIVDTAARMWTDGSDARELAEFFRQCVEPDAALRAFSSARGYNVMDLLPDVAARTLILHRPHAPAQRDEIAQALAAAIPDAELSMLEGEAPSPFSGDIDASVAAIERFLGIEAPDTGPGRADGAVQELTPREAEVLRLVARGLANKEIARELDLSVHTVERHLTNLYPKIGCRSRTEAAAFALNHGHV